MKSRMPIEIPLSRGLVTLIDKEDFPLVGRFKWYAGRNKNRFYACRRIRKGVGGLLYLHRFLLDPPLGFSVDHKNGDSLDNRRENLRIATQQQNNQNQRVRAGKKTSIFKGVSFHKDTNKWQVKIKGPEKEIHLGLYLSEEEAAMAYDRAARKIFGEFAKCNFEKGGK